MLERGAEIVKQANVKDRVGTQFQQDQNYFGSNS